MGYEINDEGIAHLHKHWSSQLYDHTKHLESRGGSSQSRRCFSLYLVLGASVQSSFLTLSEKDAAREYGPQHRGGKEKDRSCQCTPLEKKKEKHSPKGNINLPIYEGANASFSLVMLNKEQENSWPR